MEGASHTIFLQRKVFGSPLQMQELEGVKQVVREQLSEAGVAAKGLSKAGTLHVASLAIFYSSFWLFRFHILALSLCTTWSSGDYMDGFEEFWL